MASEIQATMSPGYRWRLAIISLVLLGFGGWCLYDGLVKYPAQNRHIEQSAQALTRFQEEHSHNWQQLWTDHARAQGLLEDPKSETYYNDWDIYTQYIMAALTLPAGLLVGLAYLRGRGRWIAMDQQGLRTSWGQTAPWDSIRELDKARWKSKGIAVVRYDDRGSLRRITLDDWKYQRDPITAMVARVEAHLNQAAPSPAGQDQPTASAAEER